MYSTVVVFNSEAWRSSARILGPTVSLCRAGGVSCTSTRIELVEEEKNTQTGRIQERRDGEQSSSGGKFAAGWC